MTSISVADCQVDGGYLSEFCNVHYKSLPLETEPKVDEKLESEKSPKNSDEHLKIKISGLTQELNEMKEFMADKMKKQVIKNYVAVIAYNYSLYLEP